MFSQNKDRVHLVLLLSLFCALTVFLSGCKVIHSGKIIDYSTFLLYIPSSLDMRKPHPLVIALSPDGDVRGMIDLWQNVSEELQWVVCASKTYHNGMDLLGDIPRLFEELVLNLDNVSRSVPIDRLRIIAAGFSGGGMGAHMFAYYFPNVISAIVVNTGKMHDYYRNYKDRYPKGKFAVFLASPTDFRYAEMQRDRSFLEDLNWKTKWIEFQGGHSIAPKSAYEEAAHWLADEFRSATP